MEAVLLATQPPKVARANGYLTLKAPRFRAEIRSTPPSAPQQISYGLVRSNIYAYTTLSKIRVMASSRIFVKGLPPAFTDAEFKKHFSSQREITDAKIFPNRRIGYVGYKTPEDAQKAVKYFNKSFIRMSRIGVEIARPVQGGKMVYPNTASPTARIESGANDSAGEKNVLKRKRAGEAEDEEDPKLKEFLKIMKPKSKRTAWENDGMEDPIGVDNQDKNGKTVAVEEKQSDEEYEEVPKKAKKRGVSPETKDLDTEASPAVADAPYNDDRGEAVDSEVSERQAEDARPAVSDTAWARSRTSRLLGLLDDDEEEAVVGQRPREDTPGLSEDEAEPEKGTSKVREVVEAVSSMPTPPSDTDRDNVPEGGHDADLETVRSSMRLFVRNLPYGVKGEDLEAEFASFGNLEEVRFHFLMLIFFCDES